MAQELDIFQDTTKEDAFANSVMQAEQSTGGYVPSQGESINPDGEYGAQLNWEDSYQAAKKRLGVTEEEWKAFIAGINDIKTRAAEFQSSRAFQEAETLLARRVANLKYNNPELSHEEAVEMAKGEEWYTDFLDNQSGYRELWNEMDALYQSVGLSAKGANIGDGEAELAEGGLRFDFVTGDMVYTEGNVINDIGKMAILAAASWVAGPAIAQALGPMLGAAGAKAAASAIMSIASQYAASGEVDWKQAIVSAAISYGGAKLGEVVSNSDALSGIGEKISDATAKFEELVSTGNSIADAAIKAGGMDMLTQFVITGKVDVKQAALAAIMAAGQEGFSQWKASMEAAGETVGDDVLEEVVVEAKRVGTDVGGGMTMLPNGMVINEAGEIIGYMDDLDQNGDGMLGADDLQEINVTATRVDETLRPDNNFGYEMGDTVYVDANGNPVDPGMVKFGPDGYTYNGEPVEATTYDQVFGGDRGGLSWQSEGGTDGFIKYENGELAYEKVDGQWVDANGNVIDDPQLVDELTRIAANAVDVPMDQIDYTDADGNVITYRYRPYELRDNLEDGQFVGIIFGPNGEAQEVWYDPNTGTEYIKSDAGWQGVTRVDPPPETDSSVDSTSNASGDGDSDATGDPNDSTAAGRGTGGGESPSTGGSADAGASGGSGTAGGGAPSGGGFQLPDSIAGLFTSDAGDTPSGPSGGSDVAGDNAGNAGGSGTADGGTGGTTGGVSTGAGTGGTGGGDSTGAGDGTGAGVGEGTGTGETGSGEGTSGTGDSTGDGTGEGQGQGEGSGTDGGQGGGEGGGQGGGSGTAPGVGTGTAPGAGGGAGGGGGGEGGGGQRNSLAGVTFGSNQGVTGLSYTKQPVPGMLSSAPVPAMQELNTFLEKLLKQRMLT